ncbi:hypothetical protein N665_0702s0006 [Sinapis alba]|nr:hypothetical protein N665_0702s0006 [Sinapis alba]
MFTFNTISKFNPSNSMWVIKIKIICLWKVSLLYGFVYWINFKMVLYYASVKKDLVVRFDPVLKEGYSKVLVNFSVTHSVGSYRTTKHPYKIEFLNTTRVRVCEIPPHQLNGFQLVAFRDILYGVANTDYLVEFISQIVEVTQKISLKLQNKDDDRLTFIFGGKFSVYVRDGVQLHHEQDVIILRFGKMKVVEEYSSVSSAYNVSDVSANSDMEEIDGFVSLLPKEDFVLSIVDSKPLCTFSDISEKDFFFVQMCIVMCTIAATETDMGWYYLCCKVCAKKALTVPHDRIDGSNHDFFVSNNYYCVKCKTYCPKSLPSNTKFLVYDKIAQQLIRQRCVELTGAITSEIQEPNDLPAVLTDLIGKTYMFKIGIEKENYVYKNKTFKVLKIMANSENNEFDVNHSLMCQKPLCSVRIKEAKINKSV